MNVELHAVIWIRHHHTHTTSKGRRATMGQGNALSKNTNKLYQKQNNSEKI